MREEKKPRCIFFKFQMETRKGDAGVIFEGNFPEFMENINTQIQKFWLPDENQQLIQSKLQNSKDTEKISNTPRDNKVQLEFRMGGMWLRRLFQGYFFQAEMWCINRS